MPCQFSLVCRVGCLLVLSMVLHTRTIASAEEFKNFDDAMRAAAPLLRNQEYAASQAPLEAALALAKDDSQRLTAYQRLVPAYRQLPEIDKMLEAQDFVMRHTDQKAGRSIAARDVASFVHQRGKTAAAIQHYEAALKKDPKDIAALSVLAYIYKRVKQDDARAADLELRLAEVGREISQKVAERCEADAANAPQLAAWHLKEAAVAWLEAEDNAKALAAAKKSVETGPEQRNKLLTFFWHDSLGDVFAKAGEPKLALPHYQAAIPLALTAPQRSGIEKKLEEAKKAASM